jgi:hypothetical protein
MVTSRINTALSVQLGGAVAATAVSVGVTEVDTGINVNVGEIAPKEVGGKVDVTKFAAVVTCTSESTETEIHAESKVVSRKRKIIFLYMIV